MLARLSIRQRMLIIFTLIALIGGLSQLVIAGSQLQAATLAFFQHHLETDILVVAATLAEPLEHYLDGDGRTNLQHTLAVLQGEVGQDFLIVDSRYHVVGYSVGLSLQPGMQLEPTPELVQAQKNNAIGSDIRVDESGHDRMYVAAPIRYENLTVGYMVLSQPMDQAYAEVSQRWLELGGATLPVIALAIAASLWISATISRPIQELRNSALQIASGAFNARINVNAANDEVGQLGRAFNYMAEQIGTLLKAQRSFVSNAAHELRTPLMTLKLRIEALQDCALNSEQRSAYLHEVSSEIDHMAAMVSSLLILARVDEGRYQTEYIPYDSAALLHDIARQWRIEAQRANLEFEADIPADLPDVLIPANDLRIVLNNLMSNAIKYTEHGCVGLRAWSEDNTFRLSIEDSGQGFSPDEHRMLFTRFYRTPNARGRQTGTGLGLAIVQAILDHYQGAIEASSTGRGQGATFTLTLPVKVS